MSKNKINNQNKSDKWGSIIIIGIALVIVFGLAIMVSKEKENNNGNHINEITYSRYKEKIKSNDYTIVLLASPTCTHCIQYKPLMNKVADDYKLDIYYINVSSVSYDEYISLHDNITVLKDIYSEEGQPSISTPTTIIYKDGKELESILGNIKEKGFLDLLKRNGVIS